jgi:ABC-type sulfate transport system permease subunit
MMQTSANAALHSLTKRYWNNNSSFLLKMEQQATDGVIYWMSGTPFKQEGNIFVTYPFISREIIFFIENQQNELQITLCKSLGIGFINFVRLRG